MSDTPGVLKKSLFELVLPESHDSGSYDVSGGLLPEAGIWGDIIGGLDKLGMGKCIGPIVAGFTTTQPQNILQQLNGGVRVLDLRICWVNGEFRIHHGPIVCGTLKEVLLDIKRFLTDSHHELVVAVASHFSFDTFPKSNGNPYVSLANFVVDQLTPELIVRRPEDPLLSLQTTEIGKFVKDGSKIIFAYEHSFLKGEVNDHAWFPNHILGGYANVTNLPSMIVHEQKLVDEHDIDPKKSLFQLQWLLTPNERYISKKIWEAIKEEGLNLDKIVEYLDQYGLKQLAATANPALPAFMAANKDKHINTLRVDYILESGVVDLAIKLNHPI